MQSKNTLSNTGTLFAIKRYSVHDGPEIRTTFFFKGCPLRCTWCHNPEGLRYGQEYLFHAKRCLGCKSCEQVCPLPAPQPALMTSECTDCTICVDACPALARECIGWQATVEDVLQTVEKDRLFYDQSGGGVTFSGGEPLAQADFLLAVLRACGKREVHRAVDTSGYAKPSLVKAVAQETDLFLFDLKIMDRARHRQYTGVDNALILENLRMLAGMPVPVRIRLPLIPDVNDDEKNLRVMSSFLHELGLKQVDLLPYHQSARAKYRKMKKKYPGDCLQSISEQKKAAVQTLLEDHGLQVCLGG